MSTPIFGTYYRDPDSTPTSPRELKPVPAVLICELQEGLVLIGIFGADGYRTHACISSTEPGVDTFVPS